MTTQEPTQEPFSAKMDRIQTLAELIMRRTKKLQTGHPVEVACALQLVAAYRLVDAADDIEEMREQAAILQVHAYDWVARGKIAEIVQQGMAEIGGE